MLAYLAAQTAQSSYGRSLLHQMRQDLCCKMTDQSLSSAAKGLLEALTTTGVVTALQQQGPRSTFGIMSDQSPSIALPGELTLSCLSDSIL